MPKWVDKSISSYIMKQKQFPHVLLYVLDACHLKYTINANTNGKIYSFSHWEAKIPVFYCVN